MADADADTREPSRDNRMKAAYHDRYG